LCASAWRIGLGGRDGTRNSGRMIFYTLSLINVQLAQSRLDDTAHDRHGSSVSRFKTRNRAITDAEAGFAYRR